MSEPLRFATVGYRGVPREHLLSVLKAKGIGVILDVRKKPSGLADYALPDFADAVTRAGILYEHWGKFGNPYRPPAYTGPAALARFEEKARKEGQGAQLIHILMRHREASRRGVILCACPDPAMCHRGILAKLIVENTGDGLGVQHIDARPKRAAKAQGSLFGDTSIAKVEDVADEH